MEELSRVAGSLTLVFSEYYVTGTDQRGYTAFPV